MAQKKESEEYVYEKHQFVTYNSIGKQVCVKCGLVGLNNGFSNWAVEKGCNASLHSSYKSARDKFTKQFKF